MAVAGVEIRKLTKEEENCTLFILLTMKAGTKAVRMFFDQEIPPSQLAAHLNNNFYILQNLLSKRILHPSQMIIMFPSVPGKVVSSEDFDLTLMMCLLRNTTANHPPSQGWDKLPLNYEHTATADLVRVKYYRNNFLAHLPSPKISTSEFNDAWTDVADAIHRLGNGQLDAEVDEIKNLDIGNEQYMELLEKYNDLQRAVPKHIRGQQELVLQTWLDDENVFLETNASRYVFDLCDKRKNITIIGNSGVGKSAIAHHTALMLQSSGYMVLPVNDIKEIQQYWTVDKKQVFVLDDAVGTVKLDEVKFGILESCNSYLKTMSRNSESFIIFTCRSKIMNDSRVKKGSSILTETVVDLHEESIKLSRSESTRMLDNYMKSKSVILAGDTAQLITDRDYQNFPLLCRLFVSNENYQGKAETFFTKYFSVLVDELEHVKQNAKFQYVSLVLAMIYNNNFDSTHLDVFSPNGEEQKRINQILEACSIHTSASRQNISTAMDSLVGVYFIREGTRYRFMHETLYRAVMYQFGKDFPETVLSLCTSSFVREHVRLSGDENDGYFITIEANNHDILAGRLIADIKGRKFQDVFLNPVLQDATFAKCFLQLLDTYSKKQLKAMFLEPNFATDSYQIYESKAYSSDRSVLIQSLLLEGDLCAALHWLVAFNFSTVLTFLFSKLGFFKQENAFYTGLRRMSKTKIKCKGLIPIACLSGNVDMTHRLIKCKRTGDTSDIWGRLNRSPLHMAVLSKNTAMVRLLLDLGTRVDIKDANNGTPLRYAASLGLIDIILELIKKNADVNSQDNFGRSPLFLVVDTHCQSAAETEETDSSYLENTTEEINTSLSAVAEPVTFRVIRLLLKHGANVKICTKNGEWPLSVAARYGNTKIMKILLHNNGAASALKLENCSNVPANKNEQTVLHHLTETDVNLETNARETLIFTAAKNGKANIVNMLLRYGASIHEHNDDGESPLFIASKYNQTNVVSILVNHGAVLCDKTFYGETPLFTATVSGNADTVSFLLKHNARLGMSEEEIVAGLEKVDNKYSEMILPNLHFNKTNDIRLLLVAMVSEQEQVVDSIIKHIGKENVNMVAMLHVAVENGRTRIVELLLNYQKDVNHYSPSGKFPLFVAAEHGYTDVATKLLQCGALVTMATKSDESALYIASKNGHIDMVKLLLNFNHNVNQHTSEKITPLFIAAQNGHNEIVELLLQHSAAVNWCASQGQSPLFTAAMNGNSTIVKLLLHHCADINQCTKIGETPLHAALLNRSLDTAKTLLQNGIDVNKCTQIGTTALCLAAQHGYTDIVDILIELDSDVNQSTLNGESPLLMATEIGDLGIVAKLLESGADVNKSTNEKVTALHVAALNGFIDIVEVLLQFRCDVNICTLHNETPLLLATENGHVNIIKKLLQNGADVYKSEDGGAVPLHLAARNGCSAAVEVLLKFESSSNHVNICVRAKMGETPLYISSQQGHLDIVKLLLTFGAKVDNCANFGFTPLYVSAQGGHLDIINVLLLNGANVNKSTLSGKTPLFAAAHNGHKDIVKLLLEHGADPQITTIYGDTPAQIAANLGHTSVLRTIQEFISH